MKDCAECGKRLGLSEFGVNSATDDGLSRKCKKCVKAYRDSRKQKANASKPADWKRKTEDMAAYMRAWSAANPGYMTAKKKEWWAKNKDRQRVKDAVKYALKTGKLVRKPCEVCNVVPAQAHHEDYSKPLEVVWLCRKHHTERHVTLRNCVA
jgi:hypothetical protein